MRFTFWIDKRHLKGSRTIFVVPCLKMDAGANYELDKASMVSPVVISGSDHWGRVKYLDVCLAHICLPRFFRFQTASAAVRSEDSSSWRPEKMTFMKGELANRYQRRSCFAGRCVPSFSLV